MRDAQTHQRLETAQTKLWRVGKLLEKAGILVQDTPLLLAYRRTNKQLGKTLKGASLARSGAEMLVVVDRMLQRCEQALLDVGYTATGDDASTVGLALARPGSGSVLSEAGEPISAAGHGDPASDIYRHPLRVMRPLPMAGEGEGAVPQILLGTQVQVSVRSKSEIDALFRTRIVAMVGPGGVSLRDAAKGVREAIRGRGTVEFQQVVDLLSPDGRRRYSTLSARTIVRWSTRGRALQQAASDRRAVPSMLACLTHRNAYARRPRKANEELVQAIRKLALEKHSLHYSAVVIAEQLEDQGFGKVLPSLVRQVIRERIPAIEKQYFRSGWAGVSQGFDSKLNREAQFPNQVWLMDHSYLPQEAISGWRDEASLQDVDLEMDVRVGDGAAARRVSTVYCTMIKDAYSRRTLALRLWGQHPSARETLLALRDAMVRFGRPVTLYTDNGADFVSRDVAGFLALAGIRHVKTRPYEPEGRGKIERAFGTLKNRFLATLPGYRGKDCVHEWGDADLYSISEVERILVARIEEDERARPHTETGWCPAEAFETNRLVGGDIYTPGTPEALLALLPSAVATRSAKGVTFKGRTYDSEYLGIVQLGGSVTVHYDPADMQTVHFSLAGRVGGVQYLGLGTSYSREEPPPPVGEQKRRMRRVQKSQIRHVSESGGGSGHELPQLAAFNGGRDLPAETTKAPTSPVPDPPLARALPRSRTAARASAAASGLTLY